MIYDLQINDRIKLGNDKLYKVTHLKVFRFERVVEITELFPLENGIQTFTFDNTELLELANSGQLEIYNFQTHPEYFL